MVVRTLHQGAATLPKRWRQDHDDMVAGHVRKTGVTDGIYRDLSEGLLYYSHKLT